MSKVRVAVLRGGPSEEFEVSMRTGASVLSALHEHERYEPIDITISKAGEWHHEGRVRFPEHILHTFDVAFLALHGPYGEDGTIQRFLDRYGIKYTGSGAYASKIAMHKGLTKEHLRGTGILLAPHLTFTREDTRDSYQMAGEAREILGSRYVVKPISSGSSVGVSIVQDPHDLPEIIAKTLESYDAVLVEEYIDGRELTCGVVERYRNHALYAFPPIEIIPPPDASFFNYEVKYDGSTKEVCPPSLPYSVKREVEEAAMLVHSTLGLRQYSRSDFILSQRGLYFLEVNTLPGLTRESLIPKALTAVGASYTDFIHHLVEDALR